MFQEVGHYNHGLRCGKLATMTILSIQSHVSYGHVGNAAGVFILQRMGFDVWPVHTVLFSNHPGYGTFQGHTVDPVLIENIISGIEGHGVFPRCQAVIGGYIGSAATGEVLLDSVQRVKMANPECIFFCDPVMGDKEKGLYVTDDIVRFYREQGGPAADILKPNAFELEILTHQQISNVEQAIAAARILITQWDLRAVVASSVPVPHLSTAPTPSIACVAVTPDDAWLVQTPLLPIDQKGAGDAFMALFVANVLRSGNDIPMALGAAASSIWSIMNGAGSSDGQELLLIDGQAEFSNPSYTFKEKSLSL